MIRQNHVKRMLKEGKSCVGTFVKTNDPAVVEVLALVGFDFIIIDNEHTAMNRESMVNLIRAADMSNLLPTVRVRENNAAEILQALDAGALGVQVPQVDSKDDAIAVVERVKYAPIGKRGYAASQRSAGYGFMDARQYAQMSNDETMITCYCETAAGIQNLDEILTVPEVDVIFIGPYDLSQALGVVGEVNHPRVQEAIATITRKTRAAHKAVGIIAADAAATQHWIDSGIQYIALSSDLAMIAAVGKRFMADLKRR